MKSEPYPCPSCSIMLPTRYWGWQSGDCFCPNCGHSQERWLIQQRLLSYARNPKLMLFITGAGLFLFVLLGGPLTDNHPSTSDTLRIVQVETFREGVLVFFRLVFSDPNSDAAGFGFRGANGVGWAEENHLFSSPSYGRVSPGRIEYPFNHGCGTRSEYKSDVEAWIYDRASRRSPSIVVHLECSAPSSEPDIN